MTCMAWMRMPDQTWPGVAINFILMWAVMMTAMMLPSVAPMLWRYGRIAGRMAGRMAGLVAAGYFAVWMLAGVVTFPIGALLSAAVLSVPALARSAPAAVAVVTVIAGAVQFSAWKSHHLRCCRRALRGENTMSATPGATAGEAIHYGLNAGLHCVACCAPLTAVMLVLGIMDLRVMAVVTLAITLERLGPADRRIPHAIGLAAIVAGLSLLL
jgi:predicted metal-binding membrane protein